MPREKVLNSAWHSSALASYHYNLVLQGGAGTIIKRLGRSIVMMMLVKGNIAGKSLTRH